MLGPKGMKIYSGISRLSVFTSTIPRISIFPNHLFTLPSRLQSMSTAPSPQLYFVYAPDKAEEGTLERRLSVRPQHLVVAKENISKGIIRVGGMMTTPESLSLPATDRKIVASTFICQANSIEDVRRLVESDIYWTTDVWDHEKVVILPFFAATTIP